MRKFENYIGGILQTPTNYEGEKNIFMSQFPVELAAYAKLDGEV